MLAKPLGLVSTPIRQEAIPPETNSPTKMNTEIQIIAEWRVLLNNKQVGTIRECYGKPESNHSYAGKPGPILGYRYFPSGDSKGGEMFNSLMGCRNSLN